MLVICRGILCERDGLGEPRAAGDWRTRADEEDRRGPVAVLCSGSQEVAEGMVQTMRKEGVVTKLCDARRCAVVGKGHV